jgi:hypothetical protein
MTETSRLHALRLVLRVLGVFCIVGIYPLTVVWPSGWAWHAGQSHYLQMIVGIYATLGVFLIVAANDPVRHIGLVSFALWSSVVHGLIMAVQSFSAAEHRGHLYGDVPALLLVGAVLAYLSPTAARLRLGS